MSAAAAEDVKQMKRDLGLCREILLRLEEVHDDTGALHGFHPGEDDFAFEGRTFNEIGYHLELMTDAGMFGPRSGMDNGQFLFDGISWEGHDYLDAVRNPETWAKTKERATAIGGATFGVVKDIAVAYMKAELQKHGWI